MTTNPAHQEYATKHFYAYDTLDAKAFASFFREDATCTIGNFPTAVGREQIQASCEKTFSALKGAKHDTVRLLSFDEKTLVWEGAVTYTLCDGTVLAPIPASSIAELCPGNPMEVQSIRVYADFSPFMAAMRELTLKKKQSKSPFGFFSRLFSSSAAPPSQKIIPTASNSK